MNETFYLLLNEYARNNGISVRQLHRNLLLKGINITYSCLYAYFIGTICPPFEKAKKLCIALGLGLSDDEIEKILEASREYIKNNYQDIKIMNVNLKIRPETISKKYSKDVNGLKNVIEMRANELFTDEDLLSIFDAQNKRKTSAYVAYLIEKDLKENGLI